jgi:hypothetical protein
MMIADYWLFGLSCSTANTHSPKAAGADAWETSGQGIQFVPQKEPLNKLLVLLRQLLLSRKHMPMADLQCQDTKGAQQYTTVDKRCTHANT